MNSRRLSSAIKKMTAPMSKMTGMMNKMAVTLDEKKGEYECTGMGWFEWQKPV